MEKSSFIIFSEYVFTAIFGVILLVSSVYFILEIAQKKGDAFSEGWQDVIAAGLMAIGLCYFSPVGPLVSMFYYTWYLLVFVAFFLFFLGCTILSISQFF